jgi:hypothetical protein
MEYILGFLNQVPDYVWQVVAFLLPSPVARILRIITAGYNAAEAPAEARGSRAP